MKIGIISDIHSNIIALEETFKKFKDEKVEQVICIGDVIGIGPYPKKCMQFLIDRKDTILAFVRGNHENYLLNGIPRKNHNEKDAKPMKDEEIDTHIWNHSKLDIHQIDFIKNLENRSEIEINGKTIIIEHYPMDKNNRFKKHIKNPTLNEISELFEDKTANIYLFGHTHCQYYGENNGRYYINPGSLGCPINTKCANAGILEITDNKIKYEQIKIYYDISKVINEIKAMKYPLCEEIINIFYKKL